MGEYTITGVDPDEGYARGEVSTVHGTVGEALTRGCEAVLDGYLDVIVSGPFGYSRMLVNPT